MSSGPVLHFYQIPLKYSKGNLCYRADTKSFSNKTKGDNSKTKKARVVNLVCDTSSRPDLHFYQVSSKDSKGCSSYRADKKFYADADTDDDGVRPKNNMSPPPPPPHTHTQPLVGGGGGGGDIIFPLAIPNQININAHIKFCKKKYKKTDIYNSYHLEMKKKKMDGGRDIYTRDRWMINLKPYTRPLSYWGV